MKPDSEEYLNHLDHSIKEIGRNGFQQEVSDGFSSKAGGLFDLVYHTQDSRNSPKGFPDTQVPIPPSFWFLNSPPPLLVIELKVRDNKPSEDQLAWLRALRANGAWTFCLWPRHRLALREMYNANWGHHEIQKRLHVYTRRGLAYPFGPADGN